MIKQSFLTVLILITSLSLGKTTIAQECVNCWLNPQTGKLESLDNFSNSPTPETTTSQTTTLTQNNLVLVYGRTTCGWTQKMIQDLANNNIPYQFKNIDQRNIQQEIYQLLEKQGVSGNIPLPVVVVNQEAMLRPSLQEVINKRAR